MPPIEPIVPPIKSTDPAHQPSRSGGVFRARVASFRQVGAPRAVLDAAKASLDACGRGEITLGYTVADGTDGLVRAKLT